jgi:hypothetical protein
MGWSSVQKYVFVIINYFSEFNLQTFHENTVYCSFLRKYKNAPLERIETHCE